MRGDEDRVVAAFADWLTGQGWRVDREVDFVDVYAERGNDRLYAEAKGRTTERGLDLDILYGQLLRRMPPDEVGHARFAVVVPDVLLRHAQRVPARVRAALNIDIYTVREDGSVQLIEGH